MGSCWRSGTAYGDGRVYVWNVRRGALASVLRGAPPRSWRFSSPLGLPAGDLELRWHNPALGRSLRGAPGAGTGAMPRLVHTGRPPAGLLAGREARRLGRGRGFRSVDAPPRHARQPLRDTERKRGAGGGRQPRRPAGGDRRRGRRPTLGFRQGPPACPARSGVLRDGALFPRRRRASSAPSLWGLYRWPIRPDPDRGPAAIRVGPPELLRETGERAWARKRPGCPIIGPWRWSTTPAHGILLIDSRHPHPAWSRAGIIDSGGNRQHELGRRQPGWPLAGDWRLEGGLHSGLGPAQAVARAS